MGTASNCVDAVRDQTASSSFPPYRGKRRRSSLFLGSDRSPFVVPAVVVMCEAPRPECLAVYSLAPLPKLRVRVFPQ